MTVTASEVTTLRRYEDEDACIFISNAYALSKPIMRQWPTASGDSLLQPM